MLIKEFTVKYGISYYTGALLEDTINYSTSGQMEYIQGALNFFDENTPTEIIDIKAVNSLLMDYDIPEKSNPSKAIVALLSGDHYSFRNYLSDEYDLNKLNVVKVLNPLNITLKSGNSYTILAVKTNNDKDFMLLKNGNSFKFLTTDELMYTFRTFIPLKFRILNHFGIVHNKDEYKDE